MEGPILEARSCGSSCADDARERAGPDLADWQDVFDRDRDVFGLCAGGGARASAAPRPPRQIDVPKPVRAPARPSVRMTATPAGSGRHARWPTPPGRLARPTRGGGIAPRTGDCARSTASRSWSWRCSTPLPTASRCWPTWGPRHQGRAARVTRSAASKRSFRRSGRQADAGKDSIAVDIGRPRVRIVHRLARVGAVVDGFRAGRPNEADSTPKRFAGSTRTCCT